MIPIVSRLRWQDYRRLCLALIILGCELVLRACIYILPLGLMEWIRACWFNRYLSRFFRGLSSNESTGRDDDGLVGTVEMIQAR